MTVLEIRLLLHVYAVAEPFDHSDMPIYQQTKNKFISLGLIEEDKDMACGYSLLPRGKAFIKMLLTTPLPIESVTFIDPRNHETISIN